MIFLKVKGIEKDNKSRNFSNTNYVNDNDSLPKLRHYNSMNEDDQIEINVDPKKVGYEVSWIRLNFLAYRIRYTVVDACAYVHAAKYIHNL